MTLAFLYAGQGSQHPGMGRDLYREFPQVRPLFDRTAGGLDIGQLCFEAPAQTLGRTGAAQPCMGAFAAAVTRILYDQGIRPDYAAGLSLGEYGALYGAGVFSAEDLLDLLALRGRAMEEATAGQDTRMTAVLGLDPALAEQAAAEATGGPGDLAACANYNCPGQVVIGGHTPAVLRAEARCRELGARRCIPLDVSGPFHTPLMAPAIPALAAKLAQIQISPPQIPVVFNVTADLLGEGETVEGLLVRQLTSPTRFEASIRRLGALGVDTVVEIGPGKVLSGFVRKTLPNITCLWAEDADGIRETVRTIKGGN